MLVTESLNPTHPIWERRLPQPDWCIMVRLSFRMWLAYDDRDYQFMLNVERDYGREPIAGEVVIFGSDGQPAAVRVLRVEWVPDFCTLDVEPGPDALTSLHRPSSRLEEFQRYVTAGFRCPWTGYPDGIPEPDN